MYDWFCTCSLEMVLFSYAWRFCKCNVCIDLPFELIGIFFESSDYSYPYIILVVSVITSAVHLASIDLPLQVSSFRHVPISNPFSCVFITFGLCYSLCKVQSPKHPHSRRPPFFSETKGKVFLNVWSDFLLPCFHWILRKIW